MKKHLTIAAIFVGSAVLTAFLIELIHNPGAYIATLTHPLGQYRLASNKLETDRIQTRNELWKTRFDNDRLEAVYSRDSYYVSKGNLSDTEWFELLAKVPESSPSQDPLNLNSTLGEIEARKPLK